MRCLSGKFGPTFYRIALLSWLFLLGGCSQLQFPVNQKLASAADVVEGVTSNETPDDIQMVVAFSGGGTRAAALGYGVLEVLKEQQAAGPGTRLLDEIDLLTGVSGGSFAAAYYGLYGDAMFDRFETEFLNRDVQGDLVWELFKPWNWVRLASPHYGRSELAATWLDRRFLHGATLSELLDDQGPRVHLHATDLTKGTYFSFTPEQYQILCSDISEVPVSRAVAASSAVPLVTNTVVVRNYASECKNSEPAWVEETLVQGKSFSRSYHEAARIRSYADSEERPWIHLVDGGLSDNLGLRSTISYLGLDSATSVEDMPAATRDAKKIVFIVVNAETRPDTRIDKAALSPSTSLMFKAATDVPINRYNFESVLLLRQRLSRWKRKRRDRCRVEQGVSRDSRLPEACRDIDVYTVEVNFNAVQASSLREFLFRVPTTLTLPQDVVQKIRVSAGELLIRSEDYKRLIKDLSAGQ